MTQKRALLVFPDYNTVNGLSERQLFIMQQSGVLPPSVGKYTPRGAAADRDKLVSILGPSFATVVMWGEVTAHDLKEQLRVLLAHDTSVAILAFCGHGVFEHAAGQHGSLVCSFNTRVTAETVDNIAAKHRFRGTFVRILNMCDASSAAVPMNASTEPIGRAQRDVAALQAEPRSTLAEFHGMVISASTPFTSTHGNSTGSYLVKALGALFAKVPVVTYERVASLFNSGRVGSELAAMGAITDAVMVKALDADLLSSSASATSGLCGVFGCPAFQVNDCEHLCCVDESDDEF
jgi:hypothetical protein